MRTEDARHLWVQDGAVLLRLRLETSLTREQLMRLTLSGPFSPVTVGVEVGPWDRDAFQSRLLWVGSREMRCTQKPTPRRRKQWAPMAQGSTPPQKSRP